MMTLTDVVNNFRAHTMCTVLTHCTIKSSQLYGLGTPFSFFYRWGKRRLSLCEFSMLGQLLRSGAGHCPHHPTPPPLVT